MIDRIAQALHDEWNGVGGWSSLTDADLRRWRFMARAAIKAMREPTDPMTRAGGDTDLLGDGPLGNLMAEKIYAAMIDQALKA